MTMQLVDEVFFWAKVTPHRPAIIQPDLILTYRMLADAISSSLQRIAKSDFDRREPVAVLLDNPGKTLAVCFALMRSGYAIAPIDASLLPHLQTAGIRSLIHARDVQIAGGKNVRFDDGWLNDRSGTSVIPGPGSEPRADAVATVFFTSGTTGAPKKTVQTGAAIQERFNMVPLTGEADTDRTLVTMGLNTTFGFFGACTILRAGKTVCFAPIGAPTLILVGTYRVEAISASPQQAIALLEMVEKGGRYQLDSLKQIRVGGGSLTSKLAGRIQSNLCRKLFASYGTSELGKIAGASYDMIAGIPDAVGFVYPHVDIEIVDEIGIQVPTGVEGLVRCRTPYFTRNLPVNNPDLEADGAGAWWYPGDVGLRTDGGVLCIAGRSDDVINLGGAKISALTLDEALSEYPGIKDAGVCGVKGAGGIDRIWVGIVPAEGETDAAKFIMSIRSNPTFGAEIDELLVVDRIPRNRLGKIQRNELKAMLLRQKSVSTPQYS
jgi:acyl-coenzyme A synthetase/AMP-(fatty) acid ligase